MSIFRHFIFVSFLYFTRRLWPSWVNTFSQPATSSAWVSCVFFFSYIILSPITRLNGTLIRWCFGDPRLVSCCSSSSLYEIFRTRSSGICALFFGLTRVHFFFSSLSRLSPYIYVYTLTYNSEPSLSLFTLCSGIFLDVKTAAAMGELVSLRKLVTRRKVRAAFPIVVFFFLPALLEVPVLLHVHLCTFSHLLFYAVLLFFSFNSSFFFLHFKRLPYIFVPFYTFLHFFLYSLISELIRFLVPFIFSLFIIFFTFFLSSYRFYSLFCTLSQQSRRRRLCPTQFHRDPWLPNWVLVSSSRAMFLFLYCTPHLCE